jgi:hypothetical protein
MHLSLKLKGNVRYQPNTAYIDLYLFLPWRAPPPFDAP